MPAAMVAAAAIAVIAFVLWDAFETILLPRRIPSGLRLSRIVLGAAWNLWSAIGRRIPSRNARENFLGLYALLSLIGLLVIWAAGLILAFAMLEWSAGSRLHTDAGAAGFRTDLYMSGTTFFTLGLGDVSPMTALSRFITVVEAGTGFGFLALVLAYLPVLYQAFSRREASTTMLDEWAGSPPTAGVLLRRCFESRNPGTALDSLLKDWEFAAAGMLESQLSYPILSFFRSQHDNQSWLAAMSAILDATALVIAGIDGLDPFQARLTFAICRHTLVDVSQNLWHATRPITAPAESTEALAEARAWLEAAKVPVARGEEADRRLAEVRALYVPYAIALSRHLLMPLPGWLPGPKARFNWETTAWARTAGDETR
jgi:hypothetical protein